MGSQSLLKIKEFKLPLYTKYFLTVNLNNTESTEAINALYGELIEFVREHKIKPVYEKVFGKLAFRDQFLSFRAHLIKCNNLKEPPLFYIEGKPASGVPISSIILYGILAADNAIKIDYYHEPQNDICIGTILQTPKSRYLHLYGLRVPSPGNLTPIWEFRSVYQSLNKYLKENDFSPADILRTWIYLKNIHQTYGDFNTARREFFQDNKIEFTEDSKELPASTCIGGTSSDQSELTMNLICVDKKLASGKIRRLFNQYQNEAEGSQYLLKPAFSRALFIEDENLMELQVSGTASINESGDTVYLNDPYRQIKKTLINVAALLEQASMNFSDFVESSCFFKRREYYQDFLAVLKELNIGDFTNTFVIGDICRDNLLFELDGVAIKYR
jgi:enamine deaminase RidA (YjgF/YER057c/UK114 family)